MPDEDGKARSQPRTGLRHTQIDDELLINQLDWFASEGFRSYNAQIRMILTQWINEHASELPEELRPAVTAAR